MSIDVDLVISFRTSPKGSKQQKRSELAKAEDQYKLLIRTLTNAGFQAVGRRGESLGHILVFVSCPDGLLRKLVKTERDSDFLSGLPVTPLTQSHANSLPIAPADRIRLIHAYISSSPVDGGLGIHPESHQWNLVDSIVCLHDKEFNEQWIHAWTTHRIASQSIGLERVRQQFGESVALYFAFLDTYTRALVIPAVLGISFYFLGTPYSPIYSSLLCLWSIGFVEWWRVRERLISVRFGTQGSFKVEKRRADVDNRGDLWWKRELRMLASVPVILAFAAFLGVLLSSLFVLEAFVTQLYTGPGQKIASFSPTVLFVVLVPRIVCIFQACARWFTNFEGHVHYSTHSKSLTLKTFIFTALVAYLGLALSAFVYVPFGEGLMRVVQMWLYTSSVNIPNDGSELNATLADGKTDAPLNIWDVSPEHKLNPGRLRDQMFAYTVTNQIVNTFMEIGLPYVLRKVTALTSKKKADSAASTSDTNSTNAGGSTLSSPQRKKVAFEDEHPPSSPAEQTLISNVLEQLALPTYEVFDDYSEMVIQFGYVALWSTIWPLASLMALLNNVLEIRSDAFKITVHARRPIPVRAESIGPWMEAMTFLTWLGTVINAALVYLFCPRQCKGEGQGIGIGVSAVERVHRKLFDAAQAAAGTSDKQPALDGLWGEGSKATIELLTTAALIGLVASHVYLVVRVVVRHVMERVVWKESKERQEREREERGVREVFLRGLIGDETVDSKEGSKRNVMAQSEDSGFWGYEEGVEEIKRILKEA